MTRSPVLLLIFNRPDLTATTTRAIAEAKPPKLYVASDGPRSDSEVPIVEEARSLVLAEATAARIETETLFRDKNLGCKRAVEQAVTWFFEREPEGIVLEDDCVPSRSFFDFCDVMLDRYRDNPRVMHISGYNHASEETDGFTFSRFASVWGWATWARAWAFYPESLNCDTDEARRLMRSAFLTDEQHQYFSIKFDQVASGELDTWDFSWAHAVLARQGLTVRPSKNLVANVGMGDPRAAHTTRARADVTANAALEMKLGGLSAPDLELPDPNRDADYFRRMITGRFRKTRQLLNAGRSLRPT